MRIAFLSWFLLLLAFFLSGCAGPVLDLPEPTNQELTEAHRLLDHHKLPSVAAFPITREDSGSYVDAYSPTKYRMRDAVACFCDCTHLGRCDKFSSLPYNIISALCAVSEPVSPRFLWRPQLRDPADEMVLETAINGNADADALVTFNRRDFGDAPGDFGIALLSPHEALRRMPL